MYQVQKILDQRSTKKKGKLQFLVKWEGWDESQATWQPQANLKYVKNIVDQFKQTYNTKKKKGIQKVTNEAETDQKINMQEKTIQKNKCQKSTKKEKIAPKPNRTTRHSKRKQIQQVCQNEDQVEEQHMEEQIQEQKLEKVKRKVDNPKTKQKPSTKKDRVKIVGMKKIDEQFMYFAKINGQQKWHPRDEMIKNYSVELCQFYEQRIVFD